MKARFDERYHSQVQDNDSPMSLERKKTSIGRHIIIQYSDSVKVIITLAFELKLYHTCIWLLTETSSLLTAECKRQGLPTEPLSSIVALKTLETDYNIDYLLTVPGQSISFLPKEIVLVPVIGVEQVNPSQALSLDDFELIKRIGKGKFTQVYLVRMKQTGKFFALKQFPKSHLGSKMQKKLLLERDIMIKIDTPFITKLHYAFQTPEFSYFVLDYAHSGTLDVLESKIIQFKENDMRFYVSEILLALDAIHSKGYVYGNLIKKNVLINVDGHIKLCDFGNSKVGRLASSKKTQDYIPIEELEGTAEKEGNFTTDYKALGTMLYEILHGHPATIEHFTQSLTDLSEKRQLVLSSSCKDFVYGLMRKEPTNDPKGIKALLEHSWFKTVNFKDLKEKNFPAPFIPDPQTNLLVPWGVDISEIEKDARTPVVREQRTAIKLFTFKGPAVRPDDDNDMELRRRKTEKYSWGTKKAVTVADLDAKLKSKDEDAMQSTEEFGGNITPNAKTIPKYHTRRSSNSFIPPKP